MATRTPSDPQSVTRVPFPFHKVESSSTDGVVTYRWKAGTRMEANRHGDDLEGVADGMGAMVLTEVGRYTPPGYGPRVFYVRQFEAPDGEQWTNTKLRVMGAAGFTRLKKGYRYRYAVTDERATFPVEHRDDYATPEDYADAASY